MPNLQGLEKKDIQTPKRYLASSRSNILSISIGGFTWTARYARNRQITEDCHVWLVK